MDRCYPKLMKSAVGWFFRSRSNQCFIWTRLLFAPGQTVFGWIHLSCSSVLILTPFEARENKKQSSTQLNSCRISHYSSSSFEQNKLIEIIQNMNLQRVTASSNPTITQAILLSDFKFDPLNGIRLLIQKVSFGYGISTHSVI